MKSRASESSIIVRELERATEPVAHHAPYWAYHRVSSEEQKRRKTIEGQRHETSAWAAMRGIKFDRVVEDDGHSGATISGRPGFRKVVEACMKGEVGTLVVTAPDRLTRAEEWNDRTEIWTAIRKNRTFLVMTGFCEIDPFGETTDLLLSQAFTLASMERRRMRTRSFGGKMRAAQSGRLPQGKPPYGRRYDKQTGQWSIVEEEANVLRRIFTMVLEGRSTNEIPAILNREGVVSPGRKSWSQSYVSELLRGRAAVGEYATLGHTFQIPAVIDEATFEAVGRTLEANRKYTGRRASHPRLLSKLVRCGACGSGMHVRTCGKPANRQQAYRCGMWHSAHQAKVDFKRPPCAGIQHIADDVDAAVWAQVERLLSDPSLLNEAAGADRGDGGRACETEVASLERELQRIDKQVANALRLASKELVEEKDAERLLGEYKKQREQARHDLAAAIARRDATAAMAQSLGDMGDRLKAIASRMGTATAEERRALVAALFPCRPPYGVQVFPDGRIEAIGVLTPSAEESPAEESDKLTSARRSRGCSSRRHRC